MTNISTIIEEIIDSQRVAFIASIDEEGFVVRAAGRLPYEECRSTAISAN